MSRHRAIAESAPTSNPRRAAKVNARHPASKAYHSPDGGSVRLTWSPVNQTWFLLWPGDAPVEKQQVLGQFQQWEEGDREARRIVSRDAPAENPRHKRWYRVRMIEAQRGDAPGMETGPQTTHKVTGFNKQDVERQFAGQGEIISIEPLELAGPEYGTREGAAGNPLFPGERRYSPFQVVYDWAGVAWGQGLSRTVLFADSNRAAIEVVRSGKSKRACVLYVPPQAPGSTELPRSQVVATYVRGPGGGVESVPPEAVG